MNNDYNNPEFMYKNIAEMLATLISVNFDGEHLNDDFVEEYAKYCKEDAVKAVLATKIASISWDDRISQKNKEWAKAYMEQNNLDETYKGYTSLTSHPGLIDIVTTRLLNYYEEERIFALRKDIFRKMEENINRLYEKARNFSPEDALRQYARELTQKKEIIFLFEACDLEISQLELLDSLDDPLEGMYIGWEDWSANDDHLQQTLITSNERFVSEHLREVKSRCGDCE